LKRSLILAFFFFALLSNVSGQYDIEAETETQHQISLNGSTSSWGLLFKASGNLKIKSDTFNYTGYSTPAIQLGYDFFIKEKVSVGVLFSTQSMGMKVDHMVFENENQVVRRFNDFDVKVRRRYYGFKFNYHFVNNTNHDFYMGARYGGVFWKVSPSVTDTDLDSRLNSKFTGTFFPALAMGYRYKIKGRVGIGMEVSLGIPQIFSYGIDYRF